MKKMGCIFGISIMLLSSLPINGIVYGVEDSERSVTVSDTLDKATINLTQENLEEIILLLTNLLEEDPTNKEALKLRASLEERLANSSESKVPVSKQLVEDFTSIFEKVQTNEAYKVTEEDKVSFEKIERIVQKTEAETEASEEEAAAKAAADKLKAETEASEEEAAAKAAADKLKAETEVSEEEAAAKAAADKLKAETEASEEEAAAKAAADKLKAETEVSEEEAAAKAAADKLKAETEASEEEAAAKAAADKLKAETEVSEEEAAAKAAADKLKAETEASEKEVASVSTTLDDYLKNELEEIKETTDYDQSGKELITPRSFNYANNEQGVAAYMGTTRAKIVGELQRHQYDNYYLGTPFKGLTLPTAICTSPNGDPNGYGPGFNCTGFVAAAMKRSGANLNKITNVANAWGDIANAYNWRDALRQNSKYYTFNSVDQLLRSGKAQKGDIIYFEPDFSRPFYDCHIGFFWGDRSNENKFWHSYDRNIMSNIKSATPYTKLYLFKLENNNGVISDKKMNNKKFISTKTGAIYPDAYVEGLKASDNTAGLYHQEVTVTREVKNGHGTWQQFSYTKNGQRKVGWLRSRELVNFIDNKKINQIKFINKNTAVLYNRAYIPGAKNLGRTDGMKNQQVSVTETATTGYGKWYKISYKTNGVKKSGWVNAKDLDNYIDNLKVNKKMMMTKNTAVLYNRAYIPGAKNLGRTSGMKNQPVTVQESATTGYGKWYKISYKTNGVKKSGWVNASELANFVENHPLNRKAYITKNTAVLYSRAYIPGAKNLGQTTGMKNQVVALTEEATTAYGHWYKVSYEQEGVKKSGWLQAKEVTDTINQETVNRKMFIKKETAVLYDRAYTPGAKNLGQTTGMKNQVVALTEEATTAYGHWCKVSYEQKGIKKSGWLQAKELANFIDHNKLDQLMTINKETAVLYSRAYIPGAKNLGVTTGAKGKKAVVTEEATTAYGHWYKVSYEHGEQVRVGWLKSTDLDKNN